MKQLANIVVMLTVGALMLAACDGEAGLVVMDPWARPGQAGDNSAVYFIIDNSRGESDNLLRASSDAAGAVELHMSMIAEQPAGDGTGAIPEGEVMRMVPQESVAVPSRGTVDFEPGGLHVMLVDLQQNLVVGESLALTLEFEQAGEITLEVPIEMR
jgi:copper(I)-binding protein